MAEAEGISLREFGKRVGVSGEYIRRAIADGKIPADCVGHKAVGGAGKTWPVILTAQIPRAIEHWGARRDPTAVRDKEALAAGAKRGWAQRRGEDPPPSDDDGLAAPPPAATALGTASRGSNNALPPIADSKQREAAARAQMAVLELQERTGRLVHADQVKVRFINMVTTAKTRLMGVPNKAKARIPTLSLHDIEALEDLIGEALEELALDGR